MFLKARSRQSQYRISFCRPLQSGESDAEFDKTTPLLYKSTVLRSAGLFDAQVDTPTTRDFGSHKKQFG